MDRLTEEQVEKTLKKPIEEVTLQELFDVFGEEKATHLIIDIAEAYGVSITDIKPTFPPSAENQIELPRVDACSTPRAAEYLLYFFLPKHRREYLIGDLEEEMHTIIAPKFGESAARAWYWKQAISAVLHAFVADALFGKAAEMFKRLSGQ